MQIVIDNSKTKRAPEVGYFLCESGEHGDDKPAVTRITLQTPDGTGTFDATWLCQACVERMATRLHERTRIELQTARILSGDTID